MAQPPTSTPTPNPIPPSGSAPPPSPSTVTPPQSSPAAPTLKPREPLTGFRASLEHTGVPRSVLTWKPRLPSRNWTIFLTVVGTITYLYYDDRRQCKAIREEYLERVRHRGLQPTTSSLELPRKVKVIGAKWPEDDDEDRASRYFRKYVKPYLVAAAIDYDQMSAPLHGSITRQLHAQILKRRRESLGLQPPPPSLPLPVTVDPREAKQRELEGGTVIVGRASLKEYLEGMKRGWLGRVDDWDWEKSIGEELDKDGMFEKEVDRSMETLDSGPSTLEPTPTSPTTPFSPPGGSPLHNSLSFLSRPPPPSLPRPTGEQGDAPPPIPESMQIPPYPLPPQPPILFVPFVSRLGFRQIPWMMYDFFTERYRVKSGAEAALALIEGHTREFRGPTSQGTTSDLLVDSASTSSPLVTGSSSGSPARDTDFGIDSEKWYKKAFREIPGRMSTARTDYNAKLAERMKDVYDLEDGKRQLTDEERKSTKPLTTIQNLKDERRKKELRWKGSEEGYEIIKPETPVAWDERMDGWLRVFEVDPASIGAPIESEMGGSEKSM